jgi:hypothetical protein
MHRASVPFSHTYIYRGFKSGEGGSHAVGPPLPIHRPRQVLLGTSRTARLKCVEAPSCMHLTRALTSEVHLPVALTDLGSGCL